MSKDKQTELKSGIYRHYKGGEYKLIGEAAQSETGEALIIYQDIKDNKIWARPAEIFTAEVEVAGKLEPRFVYVGDEAADADNGDNNKDKNKDDWEGKYLRALADYQNLLRQTAKEKEEFFQYALSGFLQEILPVYDNLKMALAGLKEDDGQNPWIEGLKHVLKQFKEALENKGITEIKTVGEKFNHETMEALGGQGEIVKQVVRPGYKLNDKVIRAAQVITE